WNLAIRVVTDRPGPLVTRAHRVAGGSRTILYLPLERVVAPDAADGCSIVWVQGLGLGLGGLGLLQVLLKVVLGFQKILNTVLLPPAEQVLRDLALHVVQLEMGHHVPV